VGRRGKGTEVGRLGGRGGVKEEEEESKEGKEVRGMDKGRGGRPRGM